MRVSLTIEAAGSLIWRSASDEWHTLRPLGQEQPFSIATESQTTKGNSMRTVVFYPRYPALERTEAYCDSGDGKMRGPYWAYAPENRGTSELRKQTQAIDLNGRTLEIAAEAEFHTGGLQCAETELHPGEFYPRIWRWGAADGNRYVCVPRVSESKYLSSLIASLEQVESLFESLAVVFRVAHPTLGNLDTYGSAIRNLIILACTEVEAQWKGVLDANNYSKPGDRLTTQDYCLLRPAMRLDEYKLELIRYPDLPGIAPFRGWFCSTSTQSLPWYNAYNQVKHDREANFKDASLAHAIDAVAGCVVMLAAQFGERALRQYQLESMFRFTNVPSWPPASWYFGSREPPQTWKEVNYPF
jgi:hypothetical protein